MRLPEDCPGCLVSLRAIDRSGDEFRKQPENYAALRKIQCYRLFRVAGIDSFLDEATARLPAHRMLIGARLKRLPSILRKLERENGMRLSRMTDVIGLRVVCESVQAAGQVVAELSQSSWLKTVADYRQNPRSTGYRACHILYSAPQAVSPETELRVGFEIQVRTYYQHLWSLVSESFGEQVKEGGGPAEIRAYLRRLGETVRDREDQQPDEQQQTFREMGDARNLLLVRVKPGVERVTLAFGTEYAKAAAQLVHWEESQQSGFTDSLLLLGVGDVRNLGSTHASFFGAHEFPLPDWMPRMPDAA